MSWSQVTGEGAKPWSPASRQRGLYVGNLTLAMCLASHATAQVQPVVSLQRSANAPTSPTSQAMQAHQERMAILAQEKNKLLAQRPQLEKVGDKTMLARLEGDLQGIDREIARAAKEPVYEIKRMPDGPAPHASAPTGAVNPTQPEASDLVTYESWDVFKNFGKKGQKQ